MTRNTQIALGVGVGLVGASIMGYLGYKAVRLVLDRNLAPGVPIPKGSSSPAVAVAKPDVAAPAKDMADTFKPAGEAGPSTPTPAPAPSASPIPANALPYFLSAPNGDFAYYVPVQPPSDRADMWRPLPAAPTVGQTVGAVVSFVAKTGANHATTLAPVLVVVETVDNTTGALKVRTAHALIGSATEPRIKDTPLPDGVSWSLPSFAMVGAPTDAWLSSFTYQDAAA